MGSCYRTYVHTRTHTNTLQAPGNIHTMNCLCAKVGLRLLWHLQAFFVSAIRLPWLCNLGWQVFPKSCIHCVLFRMLEFVCSHTCLWRPGSAASQTLLHYGASYSHSLMLKALLAWCHLQLECFPWDCPPKEIGSISLFSKCLQPMCTLI